MHVTVTVTDFQMKVYNFSVVLKDVWRCGYELACVINTGIKFCNQQKKSKLVSANGMRDLHICEANINAEIFLEHLADIKFKMTVKQ